MFYDLGERGGCVFSQSATRVHDDLFHFFPACGQRWQSPGSGALDRSIAIHHDVCYHIRAVPCTSAGKKQADMCQACKRQSNKVIVIRILVRFACHSSSNSPMSSIRWLCLRLLKASPLLSKTKVPGMGSTCIVSVLRQSRINAQRSHYFTPLRITETPMLRTPAASILKVLRPYE